MPFALLFGQHTDKKKQRNQMTIFSSYFDSIVCTTVSMFFILSVWDFSSMRVCVRIRDLNMQIVLRQALTTTSWTLFHRLHCHRLLAFQMTIQIYSTRPTLCPSIFISHFCLSICIEPYLHEWCTAIASLSPSLTQCAPHPATGVH